MAQTILTTVRGAKLPPPSWPPCIFSRSTHHQHPQAELPMAEHSWKTHSPWAPQMLPFPLHGHFNIFNEEGEPGSNVRDKHQ